MKKPSMDVGEACPKCDGVMQFTTAVPYVDSRLVCSDLVCNFEAVWNGGEVQEYARAQRTVNVTRSEFIRQTASDLYDQLQKMIPGERGLPREAEQHINVVLCNMVLDLPESES